MKHSLGKPFITIRAASGNCDVYVGSNLLTKITSLESIQKSSGVGIVYDKTTRKLFHGRIFKNTQKNARHAFAFPAGETNKNLATAERILTFFAENGLDRNCIITAVGGGVATDVGGFVASIFLRGVPWIAAPTTLLGMVDAAIGGKTGVDLTIGKNLAGSFHPPLAVVADLDTLKTLPRRDRAGGLAEIIKIALACDSRLFTDLEKRGRDLLTCDPRELEPIIKKSILAKARLVERDERDTGARLALNLGHTTGHALEAATHYKKFHHGEAVAIGLRVAMDLAVERKLLNIQMRDRAIALLLNCKLPVEIPANLSNATILRSMRLDKKNEGGLLRFILPVDGHRARIAYISKTEAARALDAAKS